MLRSERLQISMPSPNEIKRGTVIKMSGNLFAVVDFQRVSPGKGSSFVRTRLKDLKTGKVKEITFKSAETLEFEDVQYRKMSFLFQGGTTFTFMDSSSYEQVEISTEILGDEIKYLQEESEVTIAMHGETPISMQLPLKMSYIVKEAEPAVKGDTASGNVTKNSIMENGLEVRVPIFIKPGDKIAVNTETGDYAERLNS